MQHEQDPNKLVSAWTVERYKFGMAITGVIPLDELLALLSTLRKDNICHDHKVAEMLNCDLALVAYADLETWRANLGIKE